MQSSVRFLKLFESSVLVRLTGWVTEKTRLTKNQTRTEPEPNLNRTQTEPEPSPNRTRTEPEPNLNETKGKFPKAERERPNADREKCL